MAKLWTAWCTQLGIKQRLATARHQQTDGQAEIAIKTLKRTLKKFTSYDNQDWANLLPLLAYSLNSSVSHSTGFTPFYLAFGWNPRSFPDEYIYAGPEQSLMKSIRKSLRKCRRAIAEAQMMQAKYYNARHRPFERFKKGDLVMLEAEGISWPAYSQRPTFTLPNYLGPFQVLETFSDNANLRLDLPPSLKGIHPVFCSSKVRRYFRADERLPDPSLPESSLFPFMDEMDKILDSKTRRVGRHRKVVHYFLVSWKNSTLHNNVWKKYDPLDPFWHQNHHHVAAFDPSVPHPSTVGSGIIVQKNGAAVRLLSSSFVPFPSPSPNGCGVTRINSSRRKFLKTIRIIS